MDATKQVSDKRLEGSDEAFNQVLLSFLNAVSEIDIIPIWRIIHYLEDYFDSELKQTTHLTEGMITNAFRTLREGRLVEGYFRPSPLHRPTGSSLAIVLQQISQQGLVGPTNRAFAHFKAVVNSNDELTHVRLKKTASNFALLKALLNELLEEKISDSLRDKIQTLKNELE